ncbi:hypothetical protein FE275_07660 [Pseudomonas koreensis]|nr:hypothetical protein FE275_07660 [Pseudomonas koreensis]
MPAIHDGCAVTRSCTYTLVGVSLLAIAVCHSTMMSADTPLSRAGSLLQGAVAHQESSCAR